MPERLALSLSDVAERLAVSTRTVEREVAAGRLPALRVRGDRRVRASDLDAYLARGVVDEASRVESERGATERGATARVTPPPVVLLPPRLPRARAATGTKDDGFRSSFPEFERAGARR